MWCRLSGEFVPDGSNHTKMGVAVESEGVVARRNPYCGGDLEDGFEADTFLADESGTFASATFSAVADATNSLDVLLGEASFIAVDLDLPGVVADGHGRAFILIEVVVGILDQLKKEVGCGLVQIIGEPVNVV